MQDTKKVLTRKDFMTNQEVRWCPGCGDYAILSALQKSLATLGVPKEKVVCISGIGCSSRFPYYLDTYGFHTIHGRAASIATGLALSRPDLSIWVITGDGDSLSIGTNHLLHTIRRNVNINILLFNNQIYGLTKGQYSPTSKIGTVSKSTPQGSIDPPFSATQIVLGANASFVARTYDKNLAHMSAIFEEAAHHQGTSFVEILQNCIVFNDAVFDDVIAKENVAERVVFLEDNKPLLYGKDKNKSLRWNGFTLDACSSEEPSPHLNGKNPTALLHKESMPHISYPMELAHLGTEDETLPVCMGVLRKIQRPTYEEQILQQQVQSQKTKADLSLLLKGKQSWTASSEP